jgi:hypothetical protein
MAQKITTSQAKCIPEEIRDLINLEYVALHASVSMVTSHIL